LFDKRVDVFLAVTKITTLDKVLELAGPKAASRVGKLEGPQEVAGLLEVGPDRVYLVDQVLHTYNAVFAETVLDKLVVGKRDALLVDLAVTALVDELTDRLQVGIAIGNVGVDNGEHLRCSLREADENTIVNLEKTEELKDLARFRSDLVNTTRQVRIVLEGLAAYGRDSPLDTNNENQFRFLGNVE
jgi:hypothetical protein